jgi:hypothetical protein
MLGISFKHTLAIVIATAGVLASAGSASAGTPSSGLVVYNGHAGLGASVYQHDRSDLEFLALSSHAAVVAHVTDGTSNTIMFTVAAGKNEVAVETVEAPAAPDDEPREPRDA